MKGLCAPFLYTDGALGSFVGAHAHELNACERHLPGSQVVTRLPVGALIVVGVCTPITWWAGTPCALTALLYRRPSAGSLARE